MQAASPAPVVNRSLASVGESPTFAVDAAALGLTRTNTPAQNAAYLQAGIDGLTDAGGTIWVREMYPCHPVVLEKNVSLCGADGPRFKGPYPYGGGDAGAGEVPAGGGFLVTDTGTPFLRLKGANSVRDLSLHYPEQNYATTTLGAAIAYPPAIVNHGSVLWNVEVSGCSFTGAKTCIDFNHTNMTEGADFLIANNYGYPVGGYFLRMKNVFDIPRINGNHVNPGQGSRFLASSLNLTVTPQLIDANIAGGLPAFDLEVCDEFMMSQCFVFGMKTAFKITSCYGNLVACSGDLVETGIHYATESHKYLTVTGGNFIPSAGPTPANRNAVKFTGTAGYLKLVGVHAFLSQFASVVPSSVDATANGVLQVGGSGAQLVDVVGCTRDNFSGTWTNGIDNDNANATVNVLGGNL